ncbi:S26 family signal peptidase [Piscirickettsia salmonis]|uniref:S26 family signal peptidase n=1 Tax=Piscirickettsia salmonis TaxID=1238 RepID=UPI0007D862F4|nr:Peptidase S26 [Piscirickettsiaceae bacterium NZ-RLO1]
MGRNSLKHWLYAGPLFALLILTIIIVSLKNAGYGLVHQVTESMPIGWYWASPCKLPLTHGERVLFSPPQPLKDYLVQHHWLGQNMSMMKQVYGVPGDFICRHANWLFINGQKTAYIQQEYAPGQALPQWQVCRIIPKNHYLLLALRVPNSFDGRYFGLIEQQQIFAKVKQL